MPTSHQRPRLSVLTFFVLIICCMIILRKSSNQNSLSGQTRRRQRGSSANALTGNTRGPALFTVILNHDTHSDGVNAAYVCQTEAPHQQPPNHAHGGRAAHPSRRGWRSMMRSGLSPSDELATANAYQENVPPPAYDEIFANTPRLNGTVTAVPVVLAQDSHLKPSEAETSAEPAPLPHDTNNNANNQNTPQIHSDTINIEIPSDAVGPVSPVNASSNGNPPHRRPGVAVPLSAGLAANLNRSTPEEHKPPSYDEAINMSPI